MRGATNWDWDGMKGEWLVLCVVCSVTEVGDFARGMAWRGVRVFKAPLQLSN